MVISKFTTVLAKFPGYLNLNNFIKGWK